MKKIYALIFGYNEYAFEVADNILDKYQNIKIFKSDDNNKELENKNNYDISEFDLSDNWDELREDFDMDKSIAFCSLEDDAQNIFLTISLRASFSNLTIVALSKNKESANKLSLAGANKVIPLVQTTAGMISDMLEKPIVTSVLHNILYEKSKLKIAQVRVDNNIFENKYPVDIKWNEKYGVIVLSVVQDDMSSAFIYSSKVKHHTIKKGDIFIIVGYEDDIINFEELIGGRCDVDWSHWSW